MSARRHAIALGVLTALIHNTSFAELNEAGKTLLQQGRYWQSQNDAKRATEAWRKLLLIDPQQADAIYGLGLLEIKTKNTQGANRYLEQLRKSHPGERQTLELEQAITTQSGDNPQRLENARLAAQSGEINKAIELYQQIFANKPPQGSLGVEYYSYFGYTKNGWSESRQGLERLLRQSPNDDTIKLALAKLLIVNGSTRLDGIRRLSQLATIPSVGGQATEAWREALTWLGPPRLAELPLLEEFLKVNPQDQVIREQLAKGRRLASSGGGWQQDPLVAAGLQALENDDQIGAEKAFQARLETRPDDPDALGGLGVVRQQQGNFSEAERLLNRAISKGGTRWKSALDSVRYWALLQQARDLQADGQMVKATNVVGEAMRLDPKNISGRLTLADIQAQAGQFDLASANYRQVLATDRGNPNATRGLINVMSQTGQAEEALRMLDSLSADDQEKFGDAGRLRSLRSIQLADIAEQGGDAIGAQAALVDAVQDDPDNVWTRFRLARTYLKSGDDKKARDLIDTFVKTHPDNAEALYTSALLSAESEKWQDAQTTLARIPMKRRSTAMRDLIDQVALTIQVNTATAAAKRGQKQEALALLDQLQPLAGNNAERSAKLASGYADAGDAERAREIMRVLLSQSSVPSSDLTLQYAAILLKTGDDVQVHAILRNLQNQPMGVATRKRYDDLLFLYRVRQADRLREGGDLAAAYDTLAPALAKRPGDVGATSALARMYITNGDNAKALELYKPLLQRNPKDPSVLLGAANAAVLARDNSYAENALDRLVKLQSSDPTSLTEAARIYRAMGKNSEATALLQKAVAIEQSEQQRSLNAQTIASGVAPNPFINQSGKRSQIARAPVSAIPMPAETILNNGNVASAAEQSPESGYFRKVSVPARNNISAVAADISPARLPVSSSRTVVVKSNPFVAESASQTSDIAADSISPAQRALNDIVQTNSAYINQGLNIRTNNSESGLSKLTDVETPFEVNFPVGDSRLALRVTPVSLDAGTVGGNSASRFGNGSTSAAGIGSQRDSGVGFSLAYERPDAGIKADIGKTPLGFQYSNVVGGASIAQPFSNNSNMNFGVSLSRRAVTDSLTSFAGTTDGRDGKSWGGVTATGGRFDLGYDDSQVGAYGYSSLYVLDGHHVESNTRLELGGGAYKYLNKTPDSSLTAGLGTTILGYKNNQNYFTYRNGGYFSPQNYFAIGVPVTWAQRNDRFTYQLKGSVGVQYFQQDAVDNSLNDTDQSKSSLGYNLEAAGEYKIASKLFVGGAVGLNNASDYRQYNVGMYLRYTFEDMTGNRMALPVSPYRSPYSY